MAINVQGVSNANVADFIRNFYTLSDDKTALDTYADQIAFGKDTFFQIGPMAPTTTRDGVLAWRQKAWDVVAARKHSVGGVYTRAGQTNIDQATPELMLYGRVDYTKKDGSTSGANWGGHMVFETSTLAAGASPKLQQYRVWLTPDA